MCKIIQQLQHDPNSLDKFVWKNDFLWYHYLLHLCKISQLKHKVLPELHTSLIGGHSRFLKIYHMIKKEFFWEGLKTDVQKFVSECLVYEKNKGDKRKMSCLL